MLLLPGECFSFSVIPRLTCVLLLQPRNLKCFGLYNYYSNRESYIIIWQYSLVSRCTTWCQNQVLNANKLRKRIEGRAWVSACSTVWWKRLCGKLYSIPETMNNTPGFIIVSKGLVREEWLIILIIIILLLLYSWFTQVEDTTSRWCVGFAQDRRIADSVRRDSVKHASSQLSSC